MRWPFWKKPPVPSRTSPTGSGNALAGERPIASPVVEAAVAAKLLAQEQPKVRRPRKPRAQPELPLARGPRADFTCNACGVMELPVAATVCPVCAGPLERHWTANVVSKPRVHQIEALLARAPQRPAVSPQYQHDVEAAQAATRGPTRRLTAADAIALGRGQGNLLFTGNSTMPTPRDQQPHANTGGIVLPRPRPMAGGIDHQYNREDVIRGARGTR